MIKAGTMIKYFPKEVASPLGEFKIGHIVMDQAFIDREQMRASFTPGGCYEIMGLEPGTYVKLTSGSGGIIMSDTPMEIRTNWDFIENAHGQVLIAGLGLGLVVLSIQSKKEVTSVTIVEKYREVVELVVPRIPLNMKVDIVVDDAFEWLPHEGEKFDTIYFDIWNIICGDHYPETKDLHKRFRKFLNRKENPKSWMDSWRREDFKSRYFEDRESSRNWRY